MTTSAANSAPVPASAAAPWSTYDALPALIWCVDDSGRTLYYNRAWRQFAGLGDTPTEQLEGEGQGAFHPDDLSICLAYLQLALSERRSFQMEFRLKRSADSAYRNIQAFVQPVQEREESVIIGFDITDNKTAEADYHRRAARANERQKLESLGVMAGGIAHDFNNLLMVIMGNMELTKERLAPSTPEYGLVKEALDAALQAVDLSRTMLTFSGRTPAQPNLVNLNELVHEAVSKMSHDVPTTVRMAFNLARPAPWTHADPVMFRQVVHGLVTNAIEAFEGASGDITLTTGIKRLGRADFHASFIDEGQPEGNYAFLEVADTGKGMSEEARKRLFEPFFSTKAIGRGLGLATVRGIVHSHGGTVQVDSVPGKGVHVRLYVPTAEPPLAKTVPIS